MLRQPPDILITTPESLFLLLTSRARAMLASVETVIVDEIHALVGTKRGAHLALSLERLEDVARRPLQRIGLSATQRPLETVARFLGGGEGVRKWKPRPVTIVDAGAKKAFDLRVEVPVEDMSRLGERLAPIGRESTVPDGRSRQPRPSERSIWPAIHPRLLELVRAAPLDDPVREQPAARRAAGDGAQRPRRARSWPAPTTARSRARSGS